MEFQDLLTLYAGGLADYSLENQGATTECAHRWEIKIDLSGERVFKECRWCKDQAPIDPNSDTPQMLEFLESEREGNYRLTLKLMKAKTGDDKQNIQDAIARRSQRIDLLLEVLAGVYREGDLLGQDDHPLDQSSDFQQHPLDQNETTASSSTDVSDLGGEQNGDLVTEHPLDQGVSSDTFQQETCYPMIEGFLAKNEISLSLPPLKQEGITPPNLYRDGDKVYFGRDDESPDSDLGGEQNGDLVTEHPLDQGESSDTFDTSITSKVSDTLPSGVDRWKDRPVEKKRRKQGEGTGSITHQKRLVRGRTREQWFYTVEFFDQGCRYSKKNYYIKKDRLGEVLRANRERRPVSEILEIINRK